MRRIISPILLTTVVALSSVLPAQAEPTQAEQEFWRELYARLDMPFTTNVDDFDRVTLEAGYRFCEDAHEYGFKDTYYTVMSHASNEKKDRIRAIMLSAAHNLCQ